MYVGTPSGVLESLYTKVGVSLCSSAGRKNSFTPCICFRIKKILPSAKKKLN
eukprot:UN08094